MVFMIPGARARMEAGAMPDVGLIDRMMQFNEQLAKAKVLVSLDGFHPSSHGARVRYANGQTMTTEGPFPYAGEIIGGYWIWKVNNKEEALGWARRVPAEDGDVIELREIMEMQEFPKDVQAKGKKLEAKMPGGAKRKAVAMGKKPAAKKKAKKKR
jgi:hypothetical protein